MNNHERVDLARWTLERQLHWVGTADAKAGALVAMYLAIGGIGGSLLGDANLNGTRMWLLIVAILISLPGLIYAVAVFFPRVDGPLDSIFFFGCIASLGHQKYCERLLEIDGSTALRDLSNQIVRNAEIASSKHRTVRLSIAWAAVALLVWFVLLASAGATS